MTGTGAQADPYIPTTMSEFITASSSNGAYVKLESDIDAYDDPDYNGKLTSPLNILATKIYSDNGYAIKNLIIQSDSFLKMQLSDVLFYNIGFINCIHKRTSSSYATIHSTGGGNVFEKVKISLRCCTYDYNWYHIFTGPNVGYTSESESLTFNNCSIYVQYTSTDFKSTLKVFENRVIFNNCNIILDGIKTTGFNSNTSVVDNKLSDDVVFFNNTALILRNWYCMMGITSVYTKIAILATNTMSSSYIAFDNFHGLSNDGTTPYNGFNVVCNNADASVIIARNATQITNISNFGNGVVVSLEQMKDQSYLESIGWIP